MFKASYMESEEFKHSIKNGDMQVKLFSFFKSDKFKNVVKLTSKELIEQLHLRANIYDLLIKNDPAAGYYIEPWVRMCKSASLMIIRPDDIEIDVYEFMKGKMEPHEVSELIKQTGISEFTTLRELRTKTKQFQAFINDIVLDEPRVLSHLNSVTPLSVGKVYEMANIAKELELSPVDSFSAHYKTKACVDAFASEPNYSPGDNIVVSLNLSHYTNREILEDMGRLLDKWRQESAIDYCQDGVKASNNALRKALTNKYLMLLDTMIANQLYPGLINDEVTLDLVYPNLNIEPESLRKTHRKNALAFADHQCLKTWERTLTHAGVWNMPVEQAITEPF